MKRVLSRGVASPYGRVSRYLKPLILSIMLTGPGFAEPVKVVALGDSLTQGYGLPPDQGFVPQLQDWLRGQGADVEIINAGVSGDTTAGGRARLDWALGDGPDAVIVTLGGNDMLRGILPAASRENLDAILGALDERGIPALLVGMRAIGNFGEGYRAEFEAIYPELAKAHGVALFPDFLQGLADLGDPAAVARDYLQGDGLHPNAKGVALIVERIGPAVLELVQGLD